MGNIRLTQAMETDMQTRQIDPANVPTKTVLGDALGLAAICVMLMVGLTLPGVF